MKIAIDLVGRTITFIESKNWNGASNAGRQFASNRLAEVSGRLFLAVSRSLGSSFQRLLRRKLPFKPAESAAIGDPSRTLMG